MKKILFLTIIVSVLSFHVAVCSAAPTITFKILGINGELLGRVISQLELKRDAIKAYDDNTINVFYQEVPKEITKTLKLYGYFQARVLANKPAHKKDKWESTFSVIVGPPVKIAGIDFVILGEGAKDEKIQKHLRNFPIRIGDIFQTAKYNDAKKFLFDLADKYGYASAFLVMKEVRICLENNTADIILHFDTGPRYYFGATTFSASFFDKIFLAKFLPYKVGETYSSKKLYSLQETLGNSNFFQKIIVKPQIQTSKNTSREVPIKVVLIPRKAEQYNVGVGFGTDTGLRGSLGMEKRYLTSTGQSFKGSLQGSNVQNVLEMHYLIPGRHPATDLYDINFIGESLNLDNGKSLAGQVGVSYTTLLKGWHQTIKLRLQHEHYQLVGQAYESATLLIPSINWLHSKSDDLVKPTKGYRVSINIQGASKYLAATSDFFQLQLDAKYMKTFFTQIQMILRGVLGFTAINDINNLPLSLQYYTGGTQSIRGFSYNSIGPGRNLTVGSVELRHRVFGDWYLATFFDIGDASNSLFVKPNQGAGVGIVWRTSIGTLELTYAKAISRSGKPGMVQFSFGPEL